MKLIEIRELEGPNLFMLGPAIKIELEADVTDLSSLQDSAEPLIRSAHALAGLSPAPVSVRRLETPGRVAIAFGWGHRHLARFIAEELAGRLTGQSSGAELDDRARLEALATITTPDDRPQWVRDSERRMPAIGVTGTNGKTTTTRLLAHILMTTGKHVGWSSSSGVYIDGAEVLSGDYSGPAGARRVLLDPDVNVAVLETARGGILLRGIAYESNDVSVFTNVTADHLDLQGVRTVEGLAEVKAVVVRMTNTAGLAVLNADDPLVLGATQEIATAKLLFTRRSNNLAVQEHLAAGGSALLVQNDAIVLRSSESDGEIAPLAEIPMTFGGRAGHMVENAMAAAGAALGLDLSIDEIAAGLRSFQNSPDLNLGRLNVFDLDGVTAIMDFAHNEIGLALLIEFSRHLIMPGGRVIVVIGTAGDRTASSLRELGRIAASQADRVIIKRTQKYLRGNTNEEMVSLYQSGVREAGAADAPVLDDEISAMIFALDEARSGDVVAIMCHEYMDEIQALLMARGKPRT